MKGTRTKREARGYGKREREIGEEGKHGGHHYVPSSFLSELSTQTHTVTSPRKSGTRLIPSEGLTQDDLVKNKHGEVVSKKKSALATKVVG